MTRTTSRLLTLVSLICIMMVIHSKQHVVVLAMLLQKWLLENVTMASTQTYGVVVLFSTLWHADIFHLRTQIQANYTKRFWIAIIWYQDLYPSLQKNLSRKSSIPIQLSDLPSQTSETTSGIVKSNPLKWRVSLSVRTESQWLKSSLVKSKTASTPRESAPTATLHKL